MILHLQLTNSADSITLPNLIKYLQERQKARETLQKEFERKGKV